MRWVGGALALVLMAVAAVLAVGQVPTQLDSAEWQHYRARFVTAEGRVVDTANGGISHSESQGYGLILATAYNDRETFERIWTWTRDHLQVRHDHLFAWRFDPETGAPNDANAAADGDLLIAWALARAAERFGAPALASEARGIARDILRKVVIEQAGLALLLPAPEGFVHETATVNLSYWLFPAFAALDRLLPTPAWDELSTSGIDLLGRARFGRYDLPPDWLLLADPLAPSFLFPPDYGYNAVRIPLHLIWGGIEDPDLLEPFLRFAAAHAGIPPATLDLVTGEAAGHPASAGVLAITALVRAVIRDDAVIWPEIAADAPYYAWSLYLLAKVAAAERTTS